MAERTKNLLADRLLRVIQDCVGAGFSRTRLFRVRPRKDERGRGVAGRAVDGPKNPFRLLLGTRDYKIKLVNKAALPCEMNVRRETDVVALEKMVDIVPEKTRNSLLRSHEHIIDRQHG